MNGAPTTTHPFLPFSRRGASARALAWALAAAFLALATLPSAAAVQRGPSELLEEVRRARDDVDPAVLKTLGESGTRAGLEALIEAEGLFSSVLMRREALFALARFDGVADCEETALQKVADFAAQAPEPELRDAAVDALAGAPSMGPHFLQLIVDSPADDEVRVRCMRALIDSSGRPDEAWFRALFEKPRQQDDKAVKKALKSGDKVRQIDTLTEIRELCFDVLAPTLSPADLAKYAREKERDANDLDKEGIRRRALQELARRGERTLSKLAVEVFEDKTETPALRSLGARLVATSAGPKTYETFVEEGLKDESVVPTELRSTLAELARGLRTAKDDKKLVKELDKARGSQAAFVLQVAAGSREAKLVEAARAALGDEDPALAVAAAEFLGATGDAAQMPPLEEALAVSADGRVASAALRALDALETDATARAERWTAATRSPRREVRNAALCELAAVDAHAHQALLIEALAHPDWTTRTAALEGLEKARTSEAVGALIARMPSEEGTLLHRLADALFRLTGQPFRTQVKSWQAWWQKEGALFTPIEPEALAKLEREEERRRLAQTTKATSFFGIRVISHRVVFILDVSGSMDDHLRGEYLGEPGPTRMSVAKSELEKCIESLEPGTLFNLILFSDGVTRWIEGGVSASKEASRSEAKAFVDRIHAGGGTNLYAALEAAFGDPEVDTILVLSDGEPSVGRFQDAFEIVREVERWNEGRGVVVNTIAVGGQLRVLRMLAESTGGRSIQFR